MPSTASQILNGRSVPDLLPSTSNNNVYTPLALWSAPRDGGAVMSLHKLTAGDGYTYLTRQVAALDGTDLGRSGLDAYYSEKGESPGVWLGAGLTSLDGVEAGAAVSAAQMRALFGEGRHPNADQLEEAAAAAGADAGRVLASSRLGRAFIHDEGDAPAFRRVVAAGFAERNEALGLPAGAALPAEERATIRTTVARELFAAEYEREPADARELAGLLARASRPAAASVAGYDLTFSPVKSVSTLWAVAPRDVAATIEDAHQAAVADTIGWIEEQASYTRTGAGGVRQVDVTGLIATAFTHRDARSGDPDLHTHVAVSNKVRALDGKWLALDGRVLHKATVAASERYNTRLEAELVDRLGVRFAERPDADPRKRAVREIVGVDPALNARWSSRRAAIDVRRVQLAAQFHADQGRPPTAVEAIRLAQQATLETRQAKHEPRSYAEQRAAWRADALDVLGGVQALDAMVDAARTTGRGPFVEVDEEWARAAAGRVVATIEQSRATWQVWHLQAEAQRLVRAAGVAPSQVEQAVQAVTGHAVSAEHCVALRPPDPVAEPDALRRRDGSSVYTVAGSQLMTSTATLAAERALVAHATTTGGRAVGADVVDMALIESAANGVELNGAQAQLVRDLTTSGARLQLAIAPAGTGKTTAMRVLARAWTEGGGDVLGLAPTAVAAAALGAQIETPADTLAKLVHALAAVDAGDDVAGAASGLPQWAQQVGPRTLLVIDEAGMCGTRDLARVVDFAVGRGASVRLVGDDQQLASVAAGGVLRDIAETAGASTLEQVMRFTDPAEGAASLAMRRGDTTAVGFYLDNGRVDVGDQATMLEAAYTAWAADRAAGVDAVILAPTRDQVAALNARARADRLQGLLDEHPDAQPDQLVGREVNLRDGNRASVGDIIVSRRNERHLPISSSDWVKNGDRWQVEAVGDAGDLAVRHLASGRHITLPAGYVAADVDLG